MSSLRPRTIRLFTLAALAALSAGCSSAPPSAPAAREQQPRQEWRRVMQKTPVPKKGCFRAAEPSTAWRRSTA